MAHILFLVVFAAGW